MKRLMLVAVIILSSGCVARQVHETSLKLKEQLVQVRKCSKANSDDPKYKKVYEDAWDEAQKSADALEQASR